MNFNWLEKSKYLMFITEQGRKIVYCKEYFMEEYFIVSC